VNIFSSFWHGSKLPLHVQLCMTSFVARGYCFRLYTYDKLSAPAGVEVMDAAEILPRNDIFYYKNPDGSDGSVACFANLFRYTLLAREGGWWVDTDVLRLDGPIPDEEVCFGWEREILINNAILRSPPRHPLIEKAVSETKAAGKDLVWGQTGPLLITRLVSEMGYERFAKPFGEIYPVNWTDCVLPTTAQGHAWTSEAVAGKPFLHLWNEWFRHRNNGALSYPEEGSYLAAQYELFGFKSPDRLRDEGSPPARRLSARP
jgi:hypothetical protein